MRPMVHIRSRRTQPLTFCMELIVSILDLHIYIYIYIYSDLPISIPFSLIQLSPPRSTPASASPCATMPSLRNILHKRNELSKEPEPKNDQPTAPPPPEFTLIRTDTHTQEILTPPADPTTPALQEPDTNTLSPSPRR